MVVNIQIKDIGILPLDKDCMIASLSFSSKEQLMRAVHNMLQLLHGPDFVELVEREFNGSLQ